MRKFQALLSLAFFACAFYVHAQQASSENLKAHVNALASGPESRNYKNIKALNNAAEYVKQELQKYTQNVQEQPYTVNGTIYKNIIALFGDPSKERIVIGAHYDVCGDQPGADDNASGVAGLLELARLFKDAQSKYCIELVAYTLEEPPFFRTENMGSYIHARSLKDQGVKVKGMICLEMIGYFDDRKGSQSYPVGLMKLFYGSRGNYISIVKQFGQGSFGRKFKRKFKHSRFIQTKTVTAPAFIPGIDFSDHLNYYRFDYKALMVGDTAFYRNARYHEATDKPETLNYEKMAGVVNAVFAGIAGL
jgi:Zn-dependent M28 family amino/carboxypeptidase